MPSVVFQKATDMNISRPSCTAGISNYLFFVYDNIYSFRLILLHIKHSKLVIRGKEQRAYRTLHLFVQLIS